MFSLTALIKSRRERRKQQQLENLRNAHMNGRLGRKLRPSLSCLILQIADACPELVRY